MRRATLVLLVLVSTDALSGCASAARVATGVGGAEPSLSAYTCQMVISEVNLAFDAVGDANDIYDYRALEVVFDMTGDGLDIYAASESGEGAEHLRDMADQADAIGDAFANDEPDPEGTRDLMEYFLDSASELKKTALRKI